MKWEQETFKYLIFQAISECSSSMAFDKIMSNNVRFSSRIPFCAVSKLIGTPAGCKEPCIISKSSYNSRFIE